MHEKREEVHVRLGVHTPGWGHASRASVSSHPYRDLGHASNGRCNGQTVQGEAVRDTSKEGPEGHLQPATRHAAHVEGSIRPRSEEKDADKTMALCEIDGHYLQRARSGSAMGDEWTRESDAYSTSAKRAAMKLRCVLRLVP